MACFFIGAIDATDIWSLRERKQADVGLS
jgi:hypothetical protein